MNLTRLEKFLIFLILFIVIAVGVIAYRIFVMPNPAGDQTSEDTTAVMATSTPAVQNSLATTTSSDNAATKITQCADILKKTTVDQKTDYQQGSVLVRFNTNIDLSNAKQILKVYGATADQDAQEQADFSTKHYLTAEVPSGQEFVKVCTLKNDSNIIYAGLNVLITLHE